MKTYKNNVMDKLECKNMKIAQKNKRKRKK